jgi:hypothetical protein
MYSVEKNYVKWYNPRTRQEGIHNIKPITYYVDYKGDIVLKNPYTGPESELEAEIRKDDLRLK